PPEDGGDDAAKADWELWNDRTFGVIAFSCTKRTRKSEQTTQDHHGPRPKRSSSTCGRSSSLVSKSLPTILEAERQYEGLLKKPTSPIRNWIGEVEKMHDRPEDTEHGLSEQQRCVQILQHLPVQFRHVVRTQRTTSKWDDLRLSIYEEERALMREEEQDSKDRQDAAFAGFHSQQAPCGSKPGGAKSSPDSSN
ncbi:unnamed protein product, partial [Tilletia laevis]